MGTADQDLARHERDMARESAAEVAQDEIQEEATNDVLAILKATGVGSQGETMRLFRRLMGSEMVEEMLSEALFAHETEGPLAAGKLLSQYVEELIDARADEISEYRRGY